MKFLLFISLLASIAGVSNAQDKPFVQPVIGQTSDEVKALDGPPDGVDHTRGYQSHHYDWYYRPAGTHQKVKLTFDNDKVQNIKTLDARKDEKKIQAADEFWARSNKMIEQGQVPQALQQQQQQALVPQSPGWFHAGLMAGFINRDVNPTEIWSEIEMTNPGQSPASVTLVARRFDGSEMALLSYNIEGGEKHVFKIEDLSTNVMSADGHPPDERLRCVVLVYATVPMASHVRMLELHGDQIRTSDLGSLSPSERGGLFFLDQGPQVDFFTISNATDEAKSALVCRGYREAGCSTASVVVPVPARGTTMLLPPSGAGGLMVNISEGLLPAWFTLAQATASTFEVHSGISFGQAVKEPE
jgi:hypothetical protein